MAANQVLSTNADPVDPAVAVARTRRCNGADSNRPSNETNARPYDAARGITDVGAINDGVCDIRRRSKAGEGYANRRDCENYRLNFCHFRSPELKHARQVNSERADSIVDRA